MPKISLVVCLYKERDLLERLLHHAEGCYDDLVVVHDGLEEAVPAGDRRQSIEAGGRDAAVDGSSKSGKQTYQHTSEARQTAAGSLQGEPQANQFPCYEDRWKSPEELSLEEPDAPPIEIARNYAELSKDAPIPTGYRLKTGQPKPGSIHELVVRYGGRFYEGPRCSQQEPHWPFAWWAAKHTWILKLDADEFPGHAMKSWLSNFRLSEMNSANCSGFTCIWPMWNGRKQVTRCYPRDRIFLINRDRVSFFGMVEQVAIPDIPFHAIEIVLNHQPQRRSFGIYNMLLRRQAYSWRKAIAHTLLGSPLFLPCWQWNSSSWPEGWQMMIAHPWTTAFKRLIKFPLVAFKRQWQYERKLVLQSLFGGNIHHFLICMAIIHLRKKSRNPQKNHK